MKEKIRHAIQLAAAALCNGFAAGWSKGTIFQGKSKLFCVPVLNCYSCPGATGACPIGSLQAVLGSANYSVSFYVLGTLMLFGILLGRLICGFFCPFGLIQELLHKLPTPKPKVPSRIDRPLRYAKYLILAGFVVIGPLLFTNYLGIGAPYFCKLICPAGTLEGGIPLVLANENLQKAVGWLFTWKTAVLITVLVSSSLIYRPFCKYLCPLGAIYALLNRFSFYQLQIDPDKCTHCGACERVCKMNVRISEHKDTAECIRCGACKEACPHHAIHTTFSGGKKSCKKETYSSQQLH